MFPTGFAKIVSVNSEKLQNFFKPIYAVDSSSSAIWAGLFPVEGDSRLFWYYHVL